MATGLKATNAIRAYSNESSELNSTSTKQSSVLKGHLFLVLSQ
jgi:hypothetical protein